LAAKPEEGVRLWTQTVTKPLFSEKKAGVLPYKNGKQGKATAWASRISKQKLWLNDRAMLA